MKQHELKIGIDARLYSETGVGRYIRNLLRELSSLKSAHEFVVFMLPDDAVAFTVPNSRWSVVEADVQWHTVSEQLKMPTLFASQALDVVHVPYFNAPVFYTKPLVVTIHDLTIERTKTGKATTLPLPLYMLKRFAYSTALARTVKNARSVIVVSDTTKQELIEKFPSVEPKTTVTYEGVDAAIRNERRANTSPYEYPYFLYVGNAYPHKNLDVLVQAFRSLVHELESDGTSKRNMPRLILVGKDDYFYKRLMSSLHGNSHASYITRREDVTDELLASLYDHARALVLPSLHEGFGLPGLEALQRGCPVICSDIPVFHEIYGDFASFVPTADVRAWTRIMHERRSKKHVRRMTDRIDSFLSRYSWKTLAQHTLTLYERSARI